MANGVVHVGSGNDKLYAFDATTVRRYGPQEPEVSFTPHRPGANGVVYVGSEDKELLSRTPFRLSCGLWRLLYSALKARALSCAQEAVSKETIFDGTMLK